MPKANNIFEVDVKGLRQLQDGKPKWFIVRELLQNAFDEDVKKVTLSMAYKSGRAYISVEDDSPDGFRDLSDSYTLFRETIKRADVKKRGRFNFGEKQVLCMSESMKIETTTGTITFDLKNGTRKKTNKKRSSGSVVSVVVKMTQAEYLVCMKNSARIITPTGIELVVNGNNTGHLIPPHIMQMTLPTMRNEYGSFREIRRTTTVHIHYPCSSSPGVAYLYEMGIPVCKIDCDYSIDVQQKIPLSMDRDMVSEKYLKQLYAGVLNHLHELVTPDTASNAWVRIATTADNINKEAVQTVITKRFGENALIAAPTDQRSMDEAISKGHRVIYGSEMNADEWSKVKEYSLLQSTAQKFKTNLVEGHFLKLDEWTKEQILISWFCKRIAFDLLNIKELDVQFYDSPQATVIADFGGNTLRFNVAKVNPEWWKLDFRQHVCVEMMDLIIHELGHSQGLHYQQSYHECITRLGAALTIKALTNPGWFDLSRWHDY